MPRENRVRLATAALAAFTLAAAVLPAQAQTHPIRPL